MRCAWSRCSHGATSRQVEVVSKGPKDLWHVYDGQPRLYKIVSTLHFVLWYASKCVEMIQEYL